MNNIATVKLFFYTVIKIKVILVKLSVITLTTKKITVLVRITVAILLGYH